MVLNWNFEVIIDFILAIIGLIFAISIYFAPKLKRVRSLLFITLSMVCGSFIMLIDGIALLYTNVLLSVLEGIIFFPAAISLIIGINYTMKESPFSIGLLICVFFGGILCYAATLPNAAKVMVEGGYLRVAWLGLFDFMGLVMSLIMLFYLFYWGLKTWLNAPLLLKREATFFFLGIMLSSIIAGTLYTLHFLNPLLIVVSDIIFIIGYSIILGIILYEPKILYILPFDVHRILVKDKNGNLLYEHDWSSSYINETMFTGFINAVQLMSEEILNSGGLLDINLKERILILHENQEITVGLVASKASKLLRDAIKGFSDEFQTQFQKELKKSLTDPICYEKAYLLIDKYFSNFPYRLIKSKNHSLLLKSKLNLIPPKLENKLKTIFPNEEEYDFIIAELLKSPPSVFEEFINLYDDIKLEMDQLDFDKHGVLKLGETKNK